MGRPDRVLRSLPPAQVAVRSMASAEDFVAVVEGEAGNRVALVVLDFDAQAAGGGGGEVEDEMAAGEDERLGEAGAAREGRVEGDEAVDAGSVAAQVHAGAGPVAFDDIEGEFGRGAGGVGLGLDEAPGGAVVAVDPAVDDVGAGADVGFAPAPEVLAVAAGHEERSSVTTEP